MKYFEYGRENPELMVMLPGGGVCYRGAEPAAKATARKYHVILVAYDGFNPDEPETEFKSVPDEARRLGDKVFPNLGHGTLAGKRPEQFLQEVQAAHQNTLEKAR